MELIGKIEALKRETEREYAQQFLEKIYRYSIPIMKKYNYKVGSLREFYPRKENLLGVNVNRGQVIRLRLRPATDRKSFLPFISVLCTMLHELVHNTYGPHNDLFNQQWDKLVNEMNSMIAKGFTGDPFIGSGRTIGTINSEPPLLRGKSPDPVNTRPGSNVSKGRKLGGSKKQNLPLREILANAALKRAPPQLITIDLRNNDNYEDLTNEEDIDREEGKEYGKDESKDKSVTKKQPQKKDQPSFEVIDLT